MDVQVTASVSSRTNRCREDYTRWSVRAGAGLDLKRRLSASIGSLTSMLPKIRVDLSGSIMIEAFREVLRCLAVPAAQQATVLVSGLVEWTQGYRDAKG